MNMSKRQIFIAVLALIVAVIAAFWAIGAATTGNGSDSPDGTDDVPAENVESIQWDENSIEDQDGNILVSSEGMPDTIQVSENTEFGVSGSFTGAELSPDKEWIAFSVNGAAHGSGWLYEIATDNISPVAFQYGGGVNTIQWSPDSQFMAFQVGTPAPSEHILLVNRKNIEGYVSEIGQMIQVEEQAGTNPPFTYEFIRWQAPHTICYSFDGGSEQCVNAKNVVDEAEDVGEEPAVSQRKVQLYYYNPDKDTDSEGNVMCSEEGLVAVDRTITDVQTPITSTVKLLLEGDLTQEEKNRGITTEFPLEGFRLEGVNLENGVATLEFSDPQNSSSGGSCQATVLREQIEETVLQFEEVEEVRITPETIFQP